MAQVYNFELTTADQARLSAGLRLIEPHILAIAEWWNLAQVEQHQDFLDHSEVFSEFMRLVEAAEWRR